MGVPQGSVLGPLLFILFISSLANVISSHTDGDDIPTRFHQYADDTQLYIGASRSNIDKQLSTLELCTNDVFDWLSHNGLALNPSKSEVVTFANPRSFPLTKLANCFATVKVAGDEIFVSPATKSLGVILDRGLSFDMHVREICKSSYFHVRALGHIRPSLPSNICKTIACSIVASCLDYCNSPIWYLCL
jgi:hypothetical protein